MVSPVSHWRCRFIVTVNTRFTCNKKHEESNSFAQQPRAHARWHIDPSNLDYSRRLYRLRSFLTVTVVTSLITRFANGGRSRETSSVGGRLSEHYAKKHLRH